MANLIQLLTSDVLSCISKNVHNLDFIPRLGITLSCKFLWNF